MANKVTVPNFSQYNFEIGDTTEVVTKQNGVNAALQQFGNSLNASIDQFNDDVEFVDTARQELDTGNIVHAPGSGLPNEAGDAYSRDVAGTEEWQDSTKLMPARSFGLGYSMGTGEGRTANDIHSTGFYTTRSGDPTLPDGVQSNGSFLLSVAFLGGTTHNGQMLMNRSSTDPRTWWRSRSSDEWSDWVEAAHSDNLLTMYGDNFGGYYPQSDNVSINNAQPGDAGLYHSGNRGTFPDLGSTFYWIRTQRIYENQAMLQEAFAYSSSGSPNSRRAYRLRSNDGTWGDWVEVFNTENFNPDTKVNTTTSVLTGDGLSGGGNLSQNRTLSVDSTVVRTSRTITAGTGLSGGGNLTANRTLSLSTGYVPIGVDQSWSNVSSGRNPGTNYTNTTGRPILVSISPSTTGSNDTTWSLLVGGVEVARGDTTGAEDSPLVTIVPAGSTYRLNVVGSSSIRWMELR